MLNSLIDGNGLVGRRLASDSPAVSALAGSFGYFRAVLLQALNVIEEDLINRGTHPLLAVA
ncbi:MAG TPA: hypothetical protein VFY73_28985 [Ideonella sp.]|uniref:hypothetical protein n=1 Tax=Ideonella sp. TaxID=1929293 RepID=UPI002E363839|nr:hypothetical protein [Ideonella sp.]HEX5688073.1 hypothetical protein [Ideonella sp.]